MNLPPSLIITDPGLLGIIIGLLACYFLCLIFYVRYKRRDRLAKHNPKPTMPGFPSPSLLDEEGHRRMDPPINLKALDAAVLDGDDK